MILFCLTLSNPCFYLNLVLQGVASVSVCGVCHHPVCEECGGEGHGDECGGEDHGDECGVLQGVRPVGEDGHHVVAILRLLSLRKTDDRGRIGIDDRYYDR